MVGMAGGCFGTSVYAISRATAFVQQFLTTNAPAITNATASTMAATAHGDGELSSITGSCFVVLVFAISMYELQWASP